MPVGVAPLRTAAGRRPLAGVLERQLAEEGRDKLGGELPEAAAEVVVQGGVEAVDVEEAGAFLR